ncbi:type II secretion system F family protein [Streptomyces sp. NBC_01373]|uniref:type II secretion system F family protein n=1 Tax=Streptomyces sp. NBC_01373 TaxID=2903843 RepID=UPI00225B4E78|nr:type II secretion system F family protein [Streptomyces sp. NBC_01373]MCX4699024.1 type II secretion system F family protein [Streptomyces sp. NBC_01373]
MGEMSTGAAVACVGAALWLLGGRHPGARRAQLLLAGGGVVGAGPPAWRQLAEELRRIRGRLRPEWWAVAAGLVLAVLGSSVLPAVAGAAGVPLLRRVRLAGEARRARERRGDAVIALCGALAGEVRAGRQPGEALLRAVREADGALGEGEAAVRDSERLGDALVAVRGFGGLGGARAVRGFGGAGVARAARGSGGSGGSGEFGGSGGARVLQDACRLGEAQAAVLAAARFGGDVPAALAVAARQPGAEGLVGLAACWRVAVDHGAGLAAGLDRLEGALRAERDQRADLRAQLAGARSTAVMLAGLPVLGLALGTALGADPLHVLLHTGAGLGCLMVGGLLEALGMWWAMRIVRGAEAM